MQVLICNSSIACLCRNPPGFGFLVYKYSDEAEQAVRKLHGRYLPCLMLPLLLMLLMVMCDMDCPFFLHFC